MAQPGPKGIAVSDRMSGIDSTWLHLDQPNNLMVVHTVFLLGGTPPWEEIEARFEQLVERFPKLRQRPVDPLLRFVPLLESSWETVHGFRASDHIDRIGISAPGSIKQLDDYAAGQAAIPMAKDRPLWHASLVEGLEVGSAILLRTHHAIADSLSMLEFIEAMADPVPLAEQAARSAKDAPAGPTKAASHDLLGMATITGSMAMDLVSPAPTVLRAPLTGRKRFGRLGPITLATLKACGRTHGGTVNDLLMAITAGAFGRYLRATGARAVDVPVIVPVNIRSRAERTPGALGNRFGLSFIDLPAGEAMAERIARIHQQMQEVKNGEQPYVTYRSMSLMGKTPALAQKLFVDQFARGACAVVTNVAGPPKGLTVAGAPLTSFLAWVPTTGDIGVGVSFDSYDGAITIGVQADTGVVPDFGQLRAAFVEELAALGVG